MHILLTTILFTITGVFALVFLGASYSAELFQSLADPHVLIGSSLVLIPFLLAYARIARYQFLLYAESASVRVLQQAFPPGLTKDGLDSSFSNLVLNTLPFPAKSLLRQALKQEWERMRTIRALAARETFDGGEFVDSYHLVLAQHRGRLEEARVLIMSICIAATVWGITLALVESNIPSTAEEIQAFNFHLFGTMGLALKVSALGLPEIAVLYLLGVKTKGWELQIIGNLSSCIRQSVSPCFNMAIFPVAVMGGVQAKTAKATANTEPAVTAGKPDSAVPVLNGHAGGTP